MTAGPLSGVTVVDLTTQLSGPFATMLLADLGADVIKIEPPDGDSVRQQGPYHPSDTERAFGGYFQSINRGKRSIAIDLKSDAGRSLLLSLVDGADVLVENFRVGVMERLDLSYETLHERNPRLVYAALRGFGDPRSGASPYATWPAYDVVSQAMGGLMAITGTDPQHPLKTGPGVGDIVPGMLMTVGLLAALRHADQTGEGQFVDVAMNDGVMAMCERVVYQHSYTGLVPGPQGNGNPQLSPFDVFPALDGMVSIAAPRDHHWVELCQLIEHAELAHDERFRTNAARVSHAAEVRQIVSRWTSTRSKAEVLGVLGGRVACGAVQDARDLFDDLHVQTRDMIVELEHPGVDVPLAVAGRPIKFSLTGGMPLTRAPRLGEDTRAVLEEIGFTPEQIDALRESGVITRHHSTEEN